MIVNDNRNKESRSDVVGLIPAAGRATRIAQLPCSKEVYPVGFKTGGEANTPVPKAICHYLLEKMRLARVTKAFIVLREGKWDILAYLGDGTSCNMNLAYLMLGLAYGVPYTIDQAYNFVKESVIAFGFPDIVFEPEDAFVQLLSRQAISEADVVLGIFPADVPQKVDMVDIDNDGQIRQIVIKPKRTGLQYTWGIAVWSPDFSRFMHEYLSVIKETAAQQPELFVGDVFNAAIQEGLKVEGVLVSDKPFLDIGTGDDLLKAVKRFLAQVE
jgi:glucose-1-phosphate thymidylyltransferase